ncbi:hypothetical protein [Luteibacter yeojuensis]|uniref:Uncharacterized protein n=1 Tax=Luteibacter yeojuensis TaxID=345309 RepID=A0A7X5QXI3_9GAMM|nr:hypothetical protein [Luteibacter yeojuensis]NID17246.1 hypothetical protein [Luteibacter yeojuensis]
MADLEPPSSPLSDDDVRWLMVRTARSLAHLWARLIRPGIRAGKPPIYPMCARDVQRGEPWLEAVSPNTSVSGVVNAVLLAQGLLIDDAVAPRPPDRRRVCLIVQHVSCGALVWSDCTLRIARRLGVTLAATPRDETNGGSLHCDIFRLDGTYAEAARAEANPPAPCHAR